VDVLRKLVTNRLTDFYIGLTDKIVGGCKAANVGDSFDVPNDDTWFHDKDRATIAVGALEEVRLERPYAFRIQGTHLLYPQGAWDVGARNPCSVLHDISHD